MCDRSGCLKDAVGTLRIGMLWGSYCADDIAEIIESHGTKLVFPVGKQPTNPDATLQVQTIEDEWN